MSHDDELLSTIISEDNVYSSSDEEIEEIAPLPLPVNGRMAQTTKTKTPQGPTLRTQTRANERTAKQALKALPNSPTSPMIYSLDRTPFMYTGSSRRVNNHRPIDKAYTAMQQGWQANTIDEDLDDNFLPEVIGFKSILSRSQSADTNDRNINNIRQTSASRIHHHQQVQQQQQQQQQRQINPSNNHQMDNILPPAGSIRHSSSKPPKLSATLNESTLQHYLAPDRINDNPQAASSTRARSARPRSGYGNRRVRRNLDGSIICV